MKRDKENSTLSCSFCMKKHTQVKRLIAGKGVFICDECINLCNEILRNEPDKKVNDIKTKSLRTPKQIKQILDDYIIGQERAKKIISVAVYNHYKRINCNKNTDDIQINKSNILLIGPTGSGKTLLARTLAHLLDVPYVVCNATSFTEAGYVGEDVENALFLLLQNADFDIERAQKGLVYIDEIDKIARKDVGHSRDVSGEGVQQALLKLLDGSVVNVPTEGRRRYSQGAYCKIDTTNILFICGGAFVGLDEIVRQRFEGINVGFIANPKEKNQTGFLLEHVISQDLYKYGFIPEFIGRFAVIATFLPLTKQELMDILVKPKNALIKQYEKIFSMEGVKLIFEDEAIELIAEMAYQSECGARALQSILENVMLDVMYELPSIPDVNECIITKDIIFQKTTNLKSAA